MRALLVILLLLASLTLVSLYRPALVPYWEQRLPAVLAEVREGRFRDALSAAVEPDPAGTVSERWSRSEPLGETAGPAPTENQEPTAPAPDSSSAAGCVADSARAAGG